MSKWQNRVVRMEEREPQTLVPNPENWRLHPSLQHRAMTGALDELGWVAPITMNERTGRLVDGHLRLELAMARGVKKVPVLVVDLSEEEERLALATLDPLGDMAERDEAALEALMQSVMVSDAELASALEYVAADDEAMSAAERREEWAGMPEFEQPSAYGIHKVVMCFKNVEALDAFARLVDQKISPQTRAIWYPEAEISHAAAMRYRSAGEDEHAS
jgi:hypothetical protein